MRIESKTEARSNFGLFEYLKTIQQHALDLIFPPMCVHCSRVDAHFCDTCKQNLSQVVIEPQQSVFEELDGLLSTGVHEGLLQSAVQALKYNRAFQVAPTLATRMAQVLSTENWQFDIVVPVPLHTQRLQKRGYNQAKVIGDELAAQLSIISSDNALLKIENTRSQVGLNRQERIENVQAAFTADETIISGKALLIVDDVYTTGATLNACAAIARQAGASKVYGITVTAARLN